MEFEQLDESGIVLHSLSAYLWPLDIIFTMMKTTNFCCLIVHVSQHRLLVPRWTSSGLADSEHPKNPCKYQYYNTVDLQLLHINYLPQGNIWEERETNVIGCWGVTLGVYFFSNPTETPQVCEKLPPLFQLCCKKKNVKKSQELTGTHYNYKVTYLMFTASCTTKLTMRGKIIHPVRER